MVVTLASPPESTRCWCTGRSSLSRTGGTASRSEPSLWTFGSVRSEGRPHTRRWTQRLEETSKRRTKKEKTTGQYWKPEEETIFFFEDFLFTACTCDGDISRGVDDFQSSLSHHIHVHQKLLPLWVQLLSQRLDFTAVQGVGHSVGHQS